MQGLLMKYFVLNPAKTDEFGCASRAAMLAYAESIEPANKDLAGDLRAWVRRTEPTLSSPVPAIGAQWPGEGGIYAGVVRGGDGQPDYHLIVSEEERTATIWKDATDWATKSVEAHHDWTLPKRKEQAILFGNVPEVFAKEWYWSSEQYAGDDGWAWSQSFDDGHQIITHKHDQLRARAVRRLIL